MDFTFENHGSIWLCRPASDDRKLDLILHLTDNTSDEAQWFGDALAVEPRYVGDLWVGLVNAGYTVDGPGLHFPARQ